MRRVSALALILLCGAARASTIPSVDSFRVVPQYPDPAAGASITLGAAETKYGRLVIWNGDAVTFQNLNTQGKPDATFKAAGDGYAGDPAFVAIRSNNKTAILGSGSTGRLYRVNDVNKDVDFVSGSEIAVPTFEDGAIMGDRYVLLDRVRDDLSGAEIVLVDTSVTPAVSRAVLQKPAGSAPAAIGYDGGRGYVYIMNATTRELRYFLSADITAAFTGETLLDWTTDGTPVGAIGQFLNGGVYGVTADHRLILGGDEGVGGTGGIQWVDPDTTPASILDTLDPAGTGPAYVIVYGRKYDQVMAIDPSVSPPDAYASTTMIPAIPPDSPCSEFDDVQTEFTAFIAEFSPAATDLDADTINDTAMLELINLYACRVNEDEPLTFATNSAYDDNREIFATEANAGALAAYGRILPVLMFMSDEMQAAVTTILNTASLPLNGSYAVVRCTDTENCTPLFFEDPVVTRGAPLSYQPYHAGGDADGDGVDNLTEWNNVVEMGGDDYDFAVAAASTRLDGTGFDSGGGGGGGCFIATAAYGTPMAAQLDSLRAFRDRNLLTNDPGAAFADAYYRLSPSAAEWLAARPAARVIARVLLTPMFHGSATLGLLICAMALGTAAVVARRATGTVQRK